MAADGSIPPTGWVATTGRDAVNAAERRICGPGAVGSAARAEGFALLGRPAATLLGTANAEGRTAFDGAQDAAWVHHRVGAAGAGAAQGFAVELLAGNAQEAADHCLVAQRIARALVRPCLCTLDPAVAGEPAFVRLPSPEVACTSLDAEPGAFGTPGEAAGQALRYVAALTGRDCGPLVTEAVDDADHVLIAMGGARASAARIAAGLRAGGVRCGAIGVTLIEPFPLDSLSLLLAGKRAVAVISATDVDAATLSAGVRGAVASLTGCALASAMLSGDDERDHAAALAALGLRPDATEPATRTPAGSESVVLGVTPASDWAESFLRGVAARLRGRGPLTLARLAKPLDDTTTLVVCAAGDGPPVVEELDIVLAPDLAALGRSLGLKALRSGGTAVLYADADNDPAWATGLSAAERAVLIGRELRLFRLRRPADAAPQPEAATDFEPLLTGALFAAAPALAGLLGGVDLNAASSEHDGSSADAELLGRGAAALEALNPLEALGREPDADRAATAEPRTASVPAQMVRVPETGSQAWDEALRHFHLTGEGAHSAAEGPPGVPLVPLALETLDIEQARAAYPLTLEAGANSREAIELGPSTVLRLYSELTRSGRGELRSAFVARARRLAGRLSELLGYPDAEGPSGSSARHLAGALGAVAGTFLDAGALSRMLPQPPETRLSPSRRARVEAAWRRLQAFVQRENRLPEIILVHPPGMRDLIVDERVRWVEHEDGLRSAVGMFDALALPDVFRAARIAELEVRHAYDEALHDRVFARFDWQSLAAEELLLLPQVVVLETGSRLRGPSLSALSELLRSGRPIHVLVTERLSELHDSGDESLNGYHAGLGYLAVAHREAFVLQSSLGAPRHLLDGLRRLVTSLRPSVALVATPDWQATLQPALQLAAAHAGRATPAFVFDPDAGETWVERFDISGNPQVESTWPRGGVRYLDAGGQEQSRDEALTFAHLASLLSAYRRHFRVIPPAAVSAEQVEIVDWLALPVDQALRRLPFIWVQTGSGRLARAVLTRELAFACRDRARTWSMFKELAGTFAAPAVDAAAAPPAETVPEAPVEDRRAELEAAGQAAVRVAMRRLVQAWVDPNGTPLLTSILPVPSGAAAPAAAQPRVEAASPAAAVATATAAPAVEGPYLDTVLCTSCNECVNLNPRLFVYDQNKQARIGDPSAGTFKQLVTAAEKCPARCIHPGTPRAGDKSATAALIARAQPFQ